MSNVPMFDWFVHYHVRQMEDKYNLASELKNVSEPETRIKHVDEKQFLDDFVDVRSEEALFRYLDSQTQVPGTYKVLEGNAIARTIDTPRESSGNTNYPQSVDELRKRSNPVDTIRIDRMEYAPKEWAKVSHYNNDDLVQEFSFKLDHETKTIVGVYRRYEKIGDEVKCVASIDNLNLGIHCVSEPIHTFSDNVYQTICDAYNATVDLVKGIPKALSMEYAPCKNP